MSDDANKSNDDLIKVYVMPGSQYAGKVLAALDSRKIPHAAIFVDMNPKKRKLPSGGTLVPELTRGDEIVIDSEVILHWIEDNYKVDLYPTEQASELSARASNQIIGGAVLYYNWVFEDGYARSMRATFDTQYLPSYVFAFRHKLIDFVAKSNREKMRKTAEAMINKPALDLDDESKVREVLMEELEYFQSLLKTDEQPYLLEGTTQPSAVDFSVHVMVERFVGSMGDTNVLPSMPEFLEESRLTRLWKWHKGMVENHPIQYKGKRLKELTKE